MIIKRVYMTNDSPNHGQSYFVFFSAKLEVLYKWDKYYEAFYLIFYLNVDE